MILKVSQIYHAAIAVDQMRIRHELPYRVIRSFQQLRRALKAEADAVRSEQLKLIDLHHGKVKEDSVVVFSSKEDIPAYQESWQRLMDETVELDVTPIDLSEYADYVCFGSADVDMDALSCFVILERGDAADGR